MRAAAVLRIALLLGFVLILPDCKLNFDLGLPELSLDISIQPVFESLSGVAVRIVYTAEVQRNLCRYSLSRRSGAQSTVLLQNEEELESGQALDIAFDGVVSEEGRYSFYFAVLEPRNGTYEVLPFLQDTVDFWVDSTPPVSSVSFSVASGCYSTPLAVSLQHPDLAGGDGSPVKIFYTTDGAEPTADSSLYDPGAPIAIGSTCTLKAVAIDLAARPGPVASQDYVLDLQVPVPPGAAPGAGVYASNLVSLSHPEYPVSAEGSPVRLFYTLDGNPPDASSAQFTGAAIALPEGGTVLRAVAVDEAGNRSPELQAVYTIDTVAPVVPTASADSQYCTAPFTVSLTHPEVPVPAGSAVQVHYTLGTIDSPPADPGAGDAVYDAPIAIDRNRVLKALAVDQAGNASPVATRTYTFLEIDSVSPASCSKSTEINAVDITGYFFDVSPQNIQVAVSDGTAQHDCYIHASSDHGVLHIIILNSYLAAMTPGPAVLTVTNRSNGDSVTWDSFQIDP